MALTKLIGTAANQVPTNGMLGTMAFQDSNHVSIGSANIDTLLVVTTKTPASATDTGTAGEICWDASYVYVCIATNTWKRAALSTW